MNDTIVAISTALGVGAISIVRLSGNDAINIVNKCFEGKDLTKVDSHTIHYGFIKNETERIDEVLVSVMRAPKTYTTEDIVEINCHGGIITTKQVLETMLNSGARLAEPGEFTKRAFLNGRIDLVESEAIMDLIESKSSEAKKMALSQLYGDLSKLITSFRDRLKNLLSSIEVNIDYPEYYDIEIVTEEKIAKEIKSMKEELKNLIEKSKSSSIIKNGIQTVILGRPNVGKSSILNKLLDEEKAIVTNVAGTTRDIVEGQTYIDGILIKFIDTAGIRKTDDIVEKIGVEKSLKAVEDADLIILVLNNNEELTAEDLEILEKTKDKQRIIVINKKDLERNIKLPENLENVVETDTNSIEGIDSLKSKIKEMFNLEKITTKDYTYLSNSRQISLITKAYQSILSAEKSLNESLPIDLIAIDLKECFDLLGQVIGISYTDEIIDNLFENFCVGK
ncbi:MAG: tRNA uridine-5-carboxymethylaminomethyl(34) synthesis GTPase MnmE [Bacilli bacterium]|nr:tRNA uridine-5-carboxymethylaminomethyl(34) synthesis GTPase MnmE [bacterium]MDY2697229.1 tRNA uridine-5-carboxymethylaminomethyl(34) synthesis GTPase MnmE [Bacilli bacterium]MDY5992893.1 tRNA uridine-5-carboxymethylaminomethyl(34) synthesis GTPase MnmE [Bacilli bacterium]MEE0014703.1 tRNA uridine-5-carboxymethylaminomethyl(34) synthesis GTPase MnmE [Bacilli bacterium]